MKILIVDDEPIVLRSLERAFQKRGHIVEVAEGGILALEKWKGNAPQVVLLDILMPDLSGPEVLNRMVKWDCTVILMSAFSGENTQDLIQRYEGISFLPKPFEDIFEVVRFVESRYENNQA